ncbi:BREX system ATP-binding domain-containing protein [Gemmatimonas sp.]|uniref:BREX system ATP-binding domain-containing protein n=1 Tax=Gemmatimonas sp. TaxID=1962908 RepID=UPI00356810B8
MTVDLLNMFEQLAEHGHAPVEGCSLFGAGYEMAFEQLRQKYLVERFARGGSAEKFVIGPFGSGKTHFLRQLMEIGRELDCVTAEVPLNKNIDFTQNLVVYQQLALELRTPRSDAHGLSALIVDATRRVHEHASSAGLPADELLESWTAGLADKDFALPAFGRVLRTAVNAHRTGDEDSFSAAARWLSGEVMNKALAKQLGEHSPSLAEVKVFAHRARLSLFQFVRHAGYQGTIVGFDEAEQSMAVDKKKMSRIFSHLLSEINAVVDLAKGSALVLYAVTPDVVEKIAVEMPMLMQRLADPGPRQGFFDGNPLAAKIDLTQRGDAVDDLERIGNRLTSLFFERIDGADRAKEADAKRSIRSVAEDVAASEASSSARRAMVKRICATLANSCLTFTSGLPPAGGSPGREAEV